MASSTRMLMLAVAAAWAIHTLEPVVIAKAGAGRAFSEEVLVRGERFPETEPSVPAQQTIGGAEILTLKSLLSNDPMRAIQAMPGVTTGDDFRSEFAIRGSGFHHLRFTFEGVPTTFLLHTVQQVRDGGSIAMLNADVLSNVTLLYGSYPQRYGDRLGAEVDFVMREGARDRPHARFTVSGTDASMVLEGPLGRARRASWLFSLRKSYLDFLLERITDEENFGFSFADAQAKVVMDSSPRHRIEVTAVLGSSRLDQSGESTGRNFLNIADNSAGLLTVGWRYARSPSTLVHQRVAIAGNQFDNTNPAGRMLASGRARDLTWRGELRHAGRALDVEAGAQLQHQARDVTEQRWETATRARRVERYDEAALWSSAYAQGRWRRGPGSITAGARLDHWGLTGGGGASPWLLGDIRLGAGFTVRGGAGLHRQAPSFEHVSGLNTGADVRAARAVHTDAGIEQSFGSTMRWQVNVYRRDERNVPRLYAGERRVMPGVPAPFVTLVAPWESALDGRARGIELLLQRRSGTGLSGWLSYAYSHTRYTDRTLGERYDGDFDQRHTVNAYASYRLRARASVAARFRSGSNVPATGFYEERDGAYHLSAVRNLTRVPPYARLDLRASRQFPLRSRRLTLFVEIINALDKENARFITPDFDAPTSTVYNLFESMLPRLPSAGVLFEF